MAAVIVLIQCTSHEDCSTMIPSVVMLIIPGSNDTGRAEQVHFTAFALPPRLQDAFLSRGELAAVTPFSGRLPLTI